MGRLEVGWPDDYKRLAGLSGGERQRVAGRAVDLALRAVGVEHDDVPDTPEDAAAEVERRDEEAWLLQASGDESGYLIAFRKARALAALHANLMGADTAEVVYEALYAMDIAPGTSIEAIF